MQYRCFRVDVIFPPPQVVFWWSGSDYMRSLPIFMQRADRSGWSQFLPCIRYPADLKLPDGCVRSFLQIRSQHPGSTFSGIAIHNHVLADEPTRYHDGEAACVNGLTRFELEGKTIRLGTSLLTTLTCQQIISSDSCKTAVPSFCLTLV
jgi:hypothetical protein